MCYVYTTSSATFYIFNKVANKTHCIVILSMRQHAPAGNRQSRSVQHWYAAAAGKGLSRSTTEQREPEGRATAGVAVTVH